MRALKAWTWRIVPTFILDVGVGIAVSVLIGPRTIFWEGQMCWIEAIYKGNEGGLFHCHTENFMI